MPKTNEPHPGPSRSQDMGGDGPSFDPSYRTVIDALNDRALTGSARAVLSQEERLLLIEPLVYRLRAGALDAKDVPEFVSGVVHGGVPVSDLIRNPVMPLDLTSLVGLKDQRWLPPHLSERRMTSDRRDGELTVQHERIVDAIQRAIRDAAVDLPVFFLGSAAALTVPSAFDIDIGTSLSLRNQHMGDYDRIFQNLRGLMSSSRRRELREGPIIGNQNHVGSVWPHFHLALGVSVSRYERALRCTSSDIFVIERSGDAEKRGSAAG